MFIHFPGLKPIESFITGAFRNSMRVVWNQVSESYRRAGEIHARACTKISEHATLRERATNLADAHP